MDLGLFDFELPDEQIARYPASPRDSSRLLLVDPVSEKFSHHQFSDLKNLLNSGDLLVRNTTKVRPARIRGRLKTGGQIEFLLLGPHPGSTKTWDCLVKPGKKIKGPTEVQLPQNQVAWVTREEEKFFIQFNLEAAELEQWIEINGEIPLPPYMKRPAEEEDKNHYQTIYAQKIGSVAAPTAGLHFTDSLVAALRAKGIQFADVNLQVGLGTFSPLQPDQEDLHEETYEVSNETIEQLNRAKASGKRIIPIGTTSVRTLESMAAFGPVGRTRLFIKPGYEFQWCQAMITNFHLPKSSLFILISSLMGRELALAAYHEAIREGYRFYSYGDAMMILPHSMT